MKKTYYSTIYKPAEDSFLLADVLKKEIPKLIKVNSNLSLLEIGSGSGIQLQTARKLGIKKQNILSTDININAVKYCKKLGFNCIQSNLFAKIKGKFDLILFNPPYLPENKYDKEKDTTGGKLGSEIINKFLRQARLHLKKEGKILLLTSSLTKNINWQGYEKTKLTSKKIFFEELMVWEVRK